jgi:hypothetical protein
MIKLLGVGLWACALTFGSAYGVVTYRMGQAGEGAGEARPSVEYIKTEMTSVPVIRKGAVEGYVVFQLTVALDEEKKKETAIDPAPFIVDEAFRAVYEESTLDFTHIEKFKFEELMRGMRDNINKRLGAELVRDILVQQLNYVDKHEVRTNWTRD